MSTRDPQPFDPAEVAATHRQLVELATSTDARDVQAVLALGAAVRLHAALEPAHLDRVLSLIDPSVREELRAQHDELARDLRFLRELAAGAPGSADLELMSRAVLDRLRTHLERDQRTLYGPMARLLALDADADHEPGEAR